MRSLPICMSKTQYSLSDDPKALGAPSGFTVTVKDASVCTRRSQRATALFTAVCAEQDAYVSAGAGFIVVSLGTISFIPGLPVKPSVKPSVKPAVKVVLLVEPSDELAVKPAAKIG